MPQSFLTDPDDATGTRPLRSARPWIVSLAAHTLLLVVLALWVLPQISAKSVQHLHACVGNDAAAIAEFTLIASEQAPSVAETFDSDRAVPIPDLLGAPSVLPSLALEAMKPIPILDAEPDGGSPGTSLEPLASSLPADARSVSGTDQIRQLDGVAGATGVVTAAIHRELQLGDTLVVWLLDASISLEQNRSVMAQQAAEFYKSIDSFNTSRDEYTGEHLLMSSVVAFGRRSREIQQPTRMGARAVEEMNRVPLDTTGKENVMTAVNNTIQLYRRTRKRRERMVIVILTDESGDDGLALEKTIANCRDAGVTLHVVGPTAVLGCQQGLQHCVMKQGGKNYSFWLTVNKGPETSLPERFFLPYWHESALPSWQQGNARSVGQSAWYGGPYRERVPSGFGPYALTRLALQTGGTFTIFDQAREASNQHTGYNLDTMRGYLPDYGSAQDYLSSIKGQPLRQFVADAAAVSFSHADLFVSPRMTFIGGRSPDYPYNVEHDYFTPADFRDRLDVALRTELARIAQASQILGQFIQAFADESVDWEYEYSKEESKRWRAWYNLSKGRLLATQVRYLEYMAATNSIGLQLARESNAIDLLPDSRLQARASALLISEATRCLNRCIAENPNTPWADLAAWELDKPFGIGIRQSTIPRPQPTATVAPRGAPVSFQFPNL